MTWERARDFIWGSRWPEPLVLIDRTDLGQVAAGTDEPLYYLRDGLGSTAALTSADGTVVERYTVDAYGTTYVETPDGQGGWQAADASAYGNPFLWTGQRYDAGVGQYHFPARTLWPAWGRWLQRDPLGYVDGVNLYEYVRGGPLNWLDPLGLEADVPPDFVGPVLPPDEFVGPPPNEPGMLSPEQLGEAYGNAPRQVTPTGKYETRTHVKYNPKTERFEVSQVDYDPHGRQKVRTGYTDHGYPDEHNDPHHHSIKYDDEYPNGIESDAVRGPAHGHPDEAPADPNGPCNDSPSEISITGLAVGTVKFQAALSVVTAQKTWETAVQVANTVDQVRRWARSPTRQTGEALNTYVDSFGNTSGDPYFYLPGVNPIAGGTLGPVTVPGGLPVVP